ncbi:hypothetical protein VUR80DRAFT_4145 [Thermomyces stellatus]
MATPFLSLHPKTARRDCSNCGYANTYNLTSTFRPVHHQAFGVKKLESSIRQTDDLRDGLQSVLLGLAYLSLTSAHAGMNYPNESDALITNIII